jgi:hypothetical protein
MVDNAVDTTTVSKAPIIDPMPVSATTHPVPELELLTLALCIDDIAFLLAVLGHTDSGAPGDKTRDEARIHREIRRKCVYESESA